MNPRLKHYAIWQFKKWWPLLAIFGVIMFLVFWLATSMPVLAYRVDQGYSGSLTDYFPNMIYYIAVPAMMMTFVMPIFVFYYRTSRQSIDTYLQAAYEENSIKRVRIFLGLFIILASFTAAYLLGLGAYGLRALSTYAALANNPDYVLVHVVIWPYIPGYFILLFAIAAQYGINCFLASLGNYVFDDILLMLFGNAILGLFVVSPTVYSMIVVSMTNYGIDSDMLTAYSSICLYNFGPVNGIVNGAIWEEPWFREVNPFDVIPVSDLVNSIISYVLNLLVGSLLFSYACFHGEPSGETLARAGARNNVVAMIPHGAALCIGILVSILGELSGLGAQVGGLSSLALVGVVFEYLSFGVVYYLVLAAWRHSFRIKKRDLIFFLAVCAFVFVLTIASMTMGLVRTYA